MTHKHVTKLKQETPNARTPDSNWITTVSVTSNVQYMHTCACAKYMHMYMHKRMC